MLLLLSIPMSLATPSEGATLSEIDLVEETRIESITAASEVVFAGTVQSREFGEGPLPGWLQTTTVIRIDSPIKGGAIGDLVSMTTAGGQDGNRIENIPHLLVRAPAPGNRVLVSGAIRGEKFIPSETSFALIQQSQDGLFDGRMKAITMENGRFRSVVAPVPTLTNEEWTQSYPAGLPPLKAYPHLDQGVPVQPIEPTFDEIVAAVAASTAAPE